jgi:serine/threonine protein kinase
VTAPQLAPGQVVAGKYTIRAPLGYGGATATYAAVLAPGRDVVVKLFSPQINQRSDVLQGFQQIVAAVNALPADTTAPILDIGFDPQTGAAYFVTDLVSMPSLLARTVQSGPLPVADVVLLMRGVARAVDAARAKNVTHGALKPRNVFLGGPPARPVRVVDFGMALVRGALPTNEGWSVAAPWMAPEQLQGPALPPSDVFAAGLVAFFALTGKPYWRSCQGPALDLAGWQQEIAAPRVPAAVRARELGATLAAGLDVPLGRALAPSPGERFASVSELAEAIAQAGGPHKMAMTMPLNAMPQAALEALRRGAVAQADTMAAPISASKQGGGDTLAIPSPLESGNAWSTGQPQQPMQPPSMGMPTQQGLSPQAMQPMAMQQPMQGLPMQQAQQPAATPYGGFQAAAQPPMQAQMQMQPQMQMPVYAQAQQSFPPPESVHLPKSRAGLWIGLVLAFVVLAGIGVVAVVFLRSAKVPTGTEPVAASAAGTTASGTPPPASTTATTAAATTAATPPPPVETQDAQAPADDAAAAAAATGKDAGAEQEPAQVTIACVPDCDTAKIDDKPLATTDAGVVSQDPVDLTPGVHTIAVGKASYLTQTKRVTLKPGQKDAETFRLIKPGTGPAVPKPCGKFLERCPN